MSKIIITGGSGLVGKELVNFFAMKHEVLTLSRDKGKGNILWNPSEGVLDREALEHADVIIHLAGANIADHRWSQGYKKLIKDSRVNTTRFLVDNIMMLKAKPKVFICASAIGYYGNSDMLTSKDESSSRGPGFLANVCEAWEEESKALVSSGVRVIQLRFGIVLSKQGGALAKMLPIFYSCLGGKLGSGQQPMSWISIKEIPTIVDFIINTPSIFGPVNAVSPQAVTNSDFTRILCEVLTRPQFLPVPSFVISLMLGEMGDSLLLNGVNVFPRNLVQHGYPFRFPYLKEALKEIIK